MKIKKLELVGFKSFKDKTVIHYDSDITAIVGPNGCGKSNIVDAFIWVMGEMSAKHLRGSSMEDVIFAGSDKYSPTSMAEVSMVLENDGGPFPVKYLKHSEIMVTRRLYRSGESEYFINKETCRLRDIQDIFMDTGAGAKGFSIIEQGAIGKIIMSKPEERRVLIEEVAGISKFKVRKKESLRKLEFTDQNLVRLKDIIGELKRQLDSLQRQAQRAERYKKIKDELEKVELLISSKKLVELRNTISSSRKDFYQLEQEQIEATTQLTEEEQSLQKIKLEQTELDKEINLKQENFLELQKKVQQDEMKIQEIKFEIEQAHRNNELTGSLEGESIARKELLAKELTSLNEKYNVIHKEVEEINFVFQKKEEEFKKVQARENEIDQILTAKRRELLAISQNESHLEVRLASIDSQIEDAENREQDSYHILEELKNKNNEFLSFKNKTEENFNFHNEQYEGLKHKIIEVQNKREDLKLKTDEKRKELGFFTDQLNKVDSQLYGLENLQSNFEGFQQGVKNIMLWQKNQSYSLDAQGSLSLQPISEIIEVPGDYEVAMESILGNKLQMLVSNDYNSSLEALNYLKEKKFGRSSFIVKDNNTGVSNINTVAAADDATGTATATGTADVDIDPDINVDTHSVDTHSNDNINPINQEDGVLANLTEKVNILDNTYTPVIAYLLDKVVVVDSIVTAIKLKDKYQGFSFVSLDGDSLSDEGVLSGGSVEDISSGLLKRKREIKELHQKKEEWSGKKSLCNEVLKRLEEELLEVIKTWEDLQGELKEKEIKIIEIRKDLERSDMEIHNVQVAIERQDKEINQIKEQMSLQKEKSEEISSNLSEIKKKKINIEDEVNKLIEEDEIVRRNMNDLQKEVTEFQIECAKKNQEQDGILKQLDMIKNSLQEVSEKLDRMKETKTKSSESISHNQVLLEELKVELEKSINRASQNKEEINFLRNKYEDKSNCLDILQENVNKIYKNQNGLSNKLHNIQLTLEQSRIEEKNLLSNVYDKYRLHLAEKYLDYLSDFIANKEEFQENQNNAILLNIDSDKLNEIENQQDDLKQKINKMGEVNLSAIAEYDETVKRFEFLSKQHDDLVGSKEQLKRVIDRINKICSKKFQETFELVNERFINVFPALFGGGEARLELTEIKDKEEQGIDIIAKPPGKKLQYISLMSGGEKALTAVGLIFSLFLVKPSPYCLLDEVDAPLDDANVIRFNDLVHEMAKQSQIIVVTHNKHTMAVADRLYGVTMQERGVSNMVSVSLEDAQSNYIH